MRNRLLYIVGVLVVLGITSARGVVVSDFGRYEIILQRRPFGEAPPEVDLAASATPVIPAGPSFVDALTMCAITAGGGAVRVGFVDAKSTPPKTYFLFVGESEDGIQVVEANYEEETVTLRKDGDTRLLRMGGGAARAVASAPIRNNNKLIRRPRTAIPKSTLTRRQYKEERALGIRKAPISPRQVLRGATHLSNIPADVRDLAMRKYNMELIRAGGSKGLPLPIPLSDEEDAQLVEEGVLPPPIE